MLVAFACMAFSTEGAISEKAGRLRCARPVVGSGRWPKRVLELKGLGYSAPRHEFEVLIAGVVTVVLGDE